MFLTKPNIIMKKTILLVLMLATSAVFGTIIDHFRGWNDLVDGSPNIVIARCTATPGFTPPGVTPKLTMVVGGGSISDIEVISVLKGDTKPGLSQLMSFYKPFQGEVFAIFATRILPIGTNSYYSANEDYKIIPLNSDFQTSDLNGKTLDEQIQLILASRLKDLNGEIARDNEEKERLKQGLKNENGASTNSATTTPQK